MNNRNAYLALTAKAAELGLPRTFKTDLTDQDNRALARAVQGERFLWAIGSEGTHLVWVERAGDGKYTTPELVHMITETFPDVQWFAWMGDRLEPVKQEDAPEAADLLAPCYSVVIRYVGRLSPEHTLWHPTNPTFAPIVRGAFPTKAEAHRWASAHIPGSDYTVRRSR